MLSRGEESRDVCCKGFFFLMCICTRHIPIVVYTTAKCLFCSFKQIQSWVEGPCWWYLWWCGLALTPVDIMVQWKMSCQLMEELPVAAGRSVATGAMCVNLLPCHFFCLSPHSPPLLLLSSPPFSLSLSTPLHSPPDSTPSTYTPL